VSVVPSSSVSPTPSDPGKLSSAAAATAATSQWPSSNPGSAVTSLKGPSTTLPGLSSIKLSAREANSPNFQRAAKQNSSSRAATPSVRPFSSETRLNSPGAAELAGMYHATYNWCEVENFSGNMSGCFSYYARCSTQNNDEAAIDKRGLTQLAMDCVNSFVKAAEIAIKAKNPSYSAEKLAQKLTEARSKFLLGKNTEENIEGAKLYLHKQLKFDIDKGISKAQFFLSFAKAHKILFNYEEKMSIERETTLNKYGKLLAEKLEKKKQHRANQSSLASMKGLKSTHGGSHNRNKSSSSASKLAKSTQSMRTSGGGSGKGMFGDVLGAHDENKENKQDS
jgi:hypothetical protein